MASEKGAPGNQVAPTEHQTFLRSNIEAFGAGFVLGALLVGGYAVADAVEHTKIHEEIGGIETTEGFQNGITSVSVLGHTVYIDQTKQFGPYRVGMRLDANTLPTDLSAIVRPTSLKAFSTISGDPKKAAEGYQSALTHTFADELKGRGIPLELAGGLAGGIILTGAAARRRKIQTLETEVSRLRGENNALRRHPDGKTLPAPDSVLGKHRAMAAEQAPVHPSRRLGRKIGAVALTLGLSIGVGSFKWHESADSTLDSAPHYTIPGLAGTSLSEAFTLSQSDVKAINSAVNFYEQETSKQARAVAEFEQHAETSLLGQYDAITGPQAGETAFLVGSDMHSSLSMIRMATETVSLINQKFGDGTVAFALFGGDNTYGQAIEKDAVDKLGKIGGGVPEATVNGNHDSPITDEQLKDAHIQIIDGKLVKIAGVPIVGVGDPNITEFFGPTLSRDGGKTTEADAGAELYSQLEKAEGTMPVADIHEGYAAGAALGLQDITQASMTTWFNARGSNTVPWEDGVRDLPASLLIYGHWHRIIQPRTVWNSDGTWSLVMELNTMGGAIGSSTPTHFSTPLGPPGQTASFPIMFRNNASGLVTGYQMYSFSIDGKVRVGKRIRIGTADGQPAPGFNDEDTFKHRSEIQADKLGAGSRHKNQRQTH